MLINAGYKTIGLDHFVLANDELYEALQSKSLHRNFQGYCTRRTTGQVYAFGNTGISQLSTAYSQNAKDLNTYISSVNEGKYPITKGYILNKEEQITREVIASLMCNYTVSWSDIARRMNISEKEVRNALNYNKEQLCDFQEDGIIEFSEDHITVLPEAAPFVRNVAASLDKLMVNNEKRYSKSV